MNKKNYIRRIAILVFALFALPCFQANAQSQALKGSYFLDHSLNRHKLNPAFAPRADFFQLFGIGDLGIGMGTNLDIPTFLYPQNGELLTFLHPDISVKKFDGILPQYPHLDMNMNTTLFGFGFYTKNKAYWTFDFGIRAMMDIDLPRDLFLFVKKGTGTSGESFNVGNFNAYAMVGLQASLGYSKSFFEGFRAGFKIRGIAPLAYAGLNLENVRLDTAPDKWSLTTEGYAHVASAFLNVTPQADQMLPAVSFKDDFKLGDKIFAGWGAAVDLGVEYTLEIGSAVDGLSFSAAVTDLGAIYYWADAVSSFKSAGNVEWKGFQDVSIDSNDLEATLNEFTANAEKNLLNLSQMETSSGLLRSTMPTVYVGAELPFLKRSMSVGVLYSCRFSHSYPRQELTFSYNLTPCKWFALGVNYSLLNTTRTLGFVLELTPRWGPALYIGADYLPLSWTQAPLVYGESGMGAESSNATILDIIKGNAPFNIVPLAYRLNFHFGLAFHVGSKYLKRK